MIWYHEWHYTNKRILPYLWQYLKSNRENSVGIPTFWCWILKKTECPAGNPSGKACSCLNLKLVFTSVWCEQCLLARWFERGLVSIQKPDQVCKLLKSLYGLNSSNDFSNTILRIKQLIIKSWLNKQLNLQLLA